MTEARYEAGTGLPVVYLVGALGSHGCELMLVGPCSSLISVAEKTMQQQLPAVSSDCTITGAMTSSAELLSFSKWHVFLTSRTRWLHLS